MSRVSATWYFFQKKTYEKADLNFFLIDTEHDQGSAF